jgi:hypothetical protein
VIFDQESSLDGAELSAVPRQQLRRATPPTHPVGLARFLSPEVRALAEDKRFELLRVSPTRFPILLLTVRQGSRLCVTSHDET